MRQRSNGFMLIMSYASLISLGAYNAQLGVAWPSIRQTFGLPLNAMGVLLTASTVGFFLSSIMSGGIITRSGAGALLVAAGAVGAAGTLGVALSPSWWVAIVAYFGGGLSSGAFEVAMNTYVATQHGAREMNWLHAFYGIGATAAPLLVTSLLEAGISWRWGYAAVTLIDAVLLLYFVLTFRQWQAAVQPAADEHGEAGGVSPAATLRLAAVWFSIALFFVYTGMEVSTGQWAYSLLTEARGVGTAAAGVWVSVYWGSFTMGRILLGFIADRIAPTTLLRASMLGGILGAALLWWNAVTWFSFAGLAVLGVSFASIYPGMLTVTPARIGPQHAANAIGFQTGVAGLGAAALPALAGVLADGLGLEIIGPFTLAAAALTFVLHELTVPRGARAEPVGLPERPSP